MTAAGTGRGLYDDFRGYRIPAGEELDDALRTATVVVDANVLLSLYRYNETTLREFWRNRLDVMSSRGAGRDQILAALAKQQRAAVDAIQQWAKITAVAAEQRDGLVLRVRTLYTELEQAVSGHSPSTSGPDGGAKREPVVQALETLLHGRIGPEPDSAAWKAAVTEGKARVERRQPPGYLDAEKMESDLPEGPAGDYLVWCQAIEEVARRGGNLLLVTGDEKEDWWWRFRSDFIGPRQELVTELATACGAQLFMMRPTDLLRRAHVLKVEVRTESVDEAERVSREASRPDWIGAGKGAYYEAFWARLLERVRTEHPGWTRAQKPQPDNWMPFACPFKGGPYYSFNFPQGGGIRSELYIDYADGSQVEELYQGLLERKDLIEEHYGAPLSWEELPGRRASRIADYGEGDVTDVDSFDTYIDWFFGSGSRLRAAIENIAHMFRVS